jgi:hypothetical protein
MPSEHPFAAQRRLATPEDVAACYEYFLGRPPESPAAIADQLHGDPALWTLIGNFYNSAEASRRRVEQACDYISAHQDSREIVFRPDQSQVPDRAA